MFLFCFLFFLFFLLVYLFVLQWKHNPSINTYTYIYICNYRDTKKRNLNWDESNWIVNPKSLRVPFKENRISFSFPQFLLIVDKTEIKTLISCDANPQWEFLGKVIRHTRTCRKIFISSDCNRVSKIKTSSLRYSLHLSITSTLDYTGWHMHLCRILGVHINIDACSLLVNNRCMSSVFVIFQSTVYWEFTS